MIDLFSQKIILLILSQSLNNRHKTGGVNMERHEPIKKALLHAFVPINALTGRQLERLLSSQKLHDFQPGETIFGDADPASDNSTNKAAVCGGNIAQFFSAKQAALIQESRAVRMRRTFYLLDGRVTLSGSDGDIALSAGEKSAWHSLGGYWPTHRRAIAASFVKLVSFDSELLDSLLEWDQSAGYATLDINSNRAYRDDREWMVRLLRSRFFRHVPAANILQVFQRMTACQMPAGAVAVRQQQPAACCYVIKQGVCEVSVQAPGAQLPEPVAMLESGDWFGEEALLSGGLRNATVTMATDGVLMRLDRDDFDVLLREPVVREINATTAEKHLQSGACWLDVRTVDEFAAFHLDAALNMPLNVLRLKSHLLQRQKTYIACCDTGRRSATAAFLLNSAGLDVFVLEGGLNAQGNALIHRFAHKD